MKVKSIRGWLRWGEAVSAALLLWSCFLPWLFVMGAPVAAHGIREQLEGPHRLASFFTAHARVSFDYSLSLWLRALPFAAALALAAALWRRSGGPFWAATAAGIACGAGALVAFFYLRSEAVTWPFVHLGYGARLAAWTGTSLAAASASRLLPGFRR